MSLCSWSSFALKPLEIRRLPGGIIAARGTVTVTACANNDVIIMLDKEMPLPSSPSITGRSGSVRLSNDTINGFGKTMYEVVFGCWQNRRTALRRRGEEVAAVTRQTHPHAMCHPTKFETYWVHFDDGMLSVGKGDVSDGLILQWYDDTWRKAPLIASVSCWDKKILCQKCSVADGEDLGLYRLHHQLSPLTTELSIIDDLCLNEETSNQPLGSIALTTPLQPPTTPAVPSLESLCLYTYMHQLTPVTAFQALSLSLYPILTRHAEALIAAHFTEIVLLSCKNPSVISTNPLSPTMQSPFLTLDVASFERILKRNDIYVYSEIVIFYIILMYVCVDVAERHSHLIPLLAYVRWIYISDDHLNNLLSFYSQSTQSPSLSVIHQSICSYINEVKGHLAYLVSHGWHQVDAYLSLPSPSPPSSIPSPFAPNLMLSRRTGRIPSCSSLLLPPTDSRDVHHGALWWIGTECGKKEWTNPLQLRAITIKTAQSPPVTESEGRWSALGGRRYQLQCVPVNDIIIDFKQKHLLLTHVVLFWCSQWNGADTVMVRIQGKMYVPPESECIPSSALSNVIRQLTTSLETLDNVEHLLSMAEPLGGVHATEVDAWIDLVSDVFQVTLGAPSCHAIHNTLRFPCHKLRVTIYPLPSIASPSPPPLNSIPISHFEFYGVFFNDSM